MVATIRLLVAFHAIIGWGVLCTRAYSPLDVKMDEKAAEIHRVDSTNQLIYTLLMMLAVLTVYAFKRHPLKYVHESGLALLYGIVVGALIKYIGDAHTSYTYLRVAPDDSVPEPTVSPESLMHMPHSAQSDAQYSLEVPGPTRSFDRLNDQWEMPPDSLWIPLEVKDKDKNHTTCRTYVYAFKGELMNKAESAGQAYLSFKAAFDPEIFFSMVLPPIIFNAGYTLQQKYFFRNLDVILIFALLGTFVSTLVTAVVLWALLQSFLPDLRFAPSDCLYFGAAISATDPVTVLSIFSELNVQPDLNAIVLGESILNDALAVVLADSVDRFAKKLDRSIISLFDHYEIHWPLWPTVNRTATIASTLLDAPANDLVTGSSLGLETLFLFGHVFTLLLGSLAIGVCVALVSSIAAKFSQLKCHPPLDSTLMVLSAYACFCAAEALGMSGVVALLSCGICHAHYTSRSLHHTSAKFSRQFSHLLAFLADNFVFAYLGASLFTYPGHYWHFGFAVATAVAAQIGRAANIYPLSAVTNLFGRRSVLCAKFQHVLFASGLRGAMAYSLALRNTLTEPRRLVLSATCILAMTSVLGAGAYTPSFLQWLEIPCNPSRRRADSKTSDAQMCSHCSDVSTQVDKDDAYSAAKAESFHDSLWSSNRMIHSASPADQSDSNKSDDALSDQTVRASFVPSSPATPLHTHRTSSTAVDLSTNTKPHHNSHNFNQELQSLLFDSTSIDLEVAPDGAAINDSYREGRISRFFRKIDRCLMQPLFTDQQPTLLDTVPASLHWLAYMFTSHKQLAVRMARQNQSTRRSNSADNYGTYCNTNVSDTLTNRCTKCNCLFP